MKFVLGDFIAIMEREDICKPKIGKESPHKDSNQYVVRIVNFAT
jgi:hypothetical protein